MALVRQDCYLVGADENSVVGLAGEEPHPLDHAVVLPDGLVVPGERTEAGERGGKIDGVASACCMFAWAGYCVERNDKEQAVGAVFVRESPALCTICALAAESATAAADLKKGGPALALGQRKLTCLAGSKERNPTTSWPPSTQPVWTLPEL